jgi:hypothetical protein
VVLEDSEPTWVVEMRGNGLFEHRGLARQVAVAPWVRAHEAVLEVAKERAGLERREGTSLLRAFRERVHQHLGYGAFAEYTDRQLGYCHRTTAANSGRRRRWNSCPSWRGYF